MLGSSLWYHSAVKNEYDSVLSECSIFTDPGVVCFHSGMHRCCKNGQKWCRCFRIIHGNVDCFVINRAVNRGLNNNAPGKKLRTQIFPRIILTPSCWMFLLWQYKDPLSIGFFLGVVFIMTNQMLILFGIFVDRAINGHSPLAVTQSQQAMAVFAFFLFFVYGLFTILLAVFRNQVISQTGFQCQIIFLIS